MILGVGVDHIEIDRLRSVVERFPERFIRRIFTAEEQDYFERKFNRFESMASRFAAKEACMKALGTGLSMGIKWTDIAVKRTGGPPRLSLSGQARKILENMGGKKLHVSLSHSRSSAVAVVIIES